MSIFHKVRIKIRKKKENKERYSNPHMDFEAQNMKRMADGCE